jgi:hypothetical protein
MDPLIIVVIVTGLDPPSTIKSTPRTKIKIDVIGSYKLTMRLMWLTLNKNG